MRPNEGGERLGSNEFYAVPKPPLEKLSESQKAIERLDARGELHQQIDIAVRLGIVPQDGAEQGKPSDTEGTDFLLGSRHDF
jgi:hypothetical protein